MCMTCGCGLPHEDHGDKRHITYEQLREAAKAAAISRPPCRAASPAQPTTLGVGAELSDVVGKGSCTITPSLSVP